MKKYYRESVGECVSQVYEVEAENWETAKKAAFDDMMEGDHLAECEPDAVKEDNKYLEYSYIDKEECSKYTTLCKGTWATREPSGKEYWENNAWYFDDAEEAFYNGSFEEFTEWEKDEVAKYYMETVITAHHSDFGMYQTGEYNGEKWDDKDDLLSEIRNNVNEVYILGEDELPKEIEDIKGKIYNEPETVFAYIDKYNTIHYGGIGEFES